MNKLAPIFALLTTLSVFGCTPSENAYHAGARTGLTADLDRAASSGSDINGRSKSGYTPLMV
ncbi:MAG TPA: hypothetical protein VFC46_12020, partial [Humisphaera sp.]|nr:hypothetical protein [Humisphaera sp.]